jgi:hypothetical protein
MGRRHSSSPPGAWGGGGATEGHVNQPEGYMLGNIIVGTLRMRKEQTPTHLVKTLGGRFRMTPKCHLEIAGIGI